MSEIISFKADPPAQYHTIQYHYSKALKQKFDEREKFKGREADLFNDMTIELRRLLEITEDFSIILMPSEKLISPSGWQRESAPIYVNSTEEDIKNRNENCFLTSDLATYPILFDFNSSRDIDTNKITDVFIEDTNILTGEMIDSGVLTHIRSIFNQARQHIDISPSLLTGKWDINSMESCIFNTRFTFGLYPGLSVWLVKPDILDMLEKKMLKDQEWISFGQYSFGNWSHTETDWLDVYVFTKVCEDMLKRDPVLIKNETVYKSVLLYSALTIHPEFTLFTENEKRRSPTIICSRVHKGYEKLDQLFQSKAIGVDWYDPDGKGKVMRIGNFPVHSKEQMGLLVDLIDSI